MFHNNIELSVIVPWGFEILNNLSYLSRRLRRFYCYYGINTNSVIDKDKLGHSLGMSILNKLEIVDRVFYQRIVALLVGEVPILLRDSNYVCSIDDCVIVIVVKNSDDILKDYAHYIIGTLDGISRNVGEVSNYMNYLIPRWRLFQLYLMHEELFGYLLPKMSILQQRLSNEEMLKFIGKYIN